jgi:hypothetical protein
LAIEASPLQLYKKYVAHLINSRTSISISIDMGGKHIGARLSLQARVWFQRRMASTSA